MRCKYFPILFSILLFYSCGGNDEATVVKEVIRPVKYAKISSGTISGSHSFNGIAQAEKESNLSFKVSGNIRSLNVKVGDKVRKGQLLATLDASDLSIQADQANASLKGAEAQMKAAETSMKIAKSTYERIERLYESNSVSVAEFDQAKSQYESAKSQYDASKTQVTSAGKQTQAASNQVSYTRLNAPFSGIINQQMIELNELCAAGSPVFKLSSDGNSEVNVGIPENYIGKIKKGQKVQVQFSVLGDNTFNGNVTEISYATQGGTTYPAIVKLSNTNENIRPGMAATVRFDFGSGGDATKEKIFAPMSAVGENQNGNFVFVLQKSSDNVYTVQRKSVEVGGMDESGFVIDKGLKSGDLIATAGLSSLLDGMKVKLME